MARQRRGGFRPPELRGTLGTLLRTTLAQAGAVRSALERGAREGRSRIDEALAGRRRHEALAELGEVVLDLIRRGEIDLEELPEVRDIIAHLDEVDAGQHEPEHDEAVAPPVRRRFDDRGDGTVSSSTWAAPGRPAKERSKVWRPEPAASPNEPERAASSRGLEQSGGISFDDDDLADYMHPEDVPPKRPPEGDS